MKLGQTIYELRTAKNLSQGDLADLLDVSRQSVSKWENDTATPDLDKLIKLCDAFGVSLDELTGRTPTPPEQPAASAPARDPALTPQKIVGYILLVISLLAALVFVVLEREPYLYLVTVLPVLGCSLICLLVKNKAGYWCVWVACLAAEYYLLFCTTFGMVLNSYRGTPTLRFPCAVIMFFAAWFIFKEAAVPVTKMRVGALLAGWLLYFPACVEALRLVVRLCHHLYRRHEWYAGSGLEIYFFYLVNVLFILILAFLVTYSARFVRSWHLQRKTRKAP